MSSNLAKHTDTAKATKFTRGESDSAFEAKAGRTDAVNAGIVKKADAVAEAELKGARKGGVSVRNVLGRAARQAGGQEGADAGDQAARNITRQSGIALQKSRNMRSAIFASAAAEMDEADETSGMSDAYQKGSDAAALARKAKAMRASKDAVNTTATATGTNCPSAAKSVEDRARKAVSKKTKEKAAESKVRMQSRRTWLKAHGAQAKAAQAAGETAAKAGGTKTLAAMASGALAPAAGVIAGIIAFVLVMMVVSQLISALFGFWENEAAKQSMAGLPPYITQEMVVTALECQEKYGHPAGCTIAQIICESGQGDHLSGLATRDNNLFGIKWASSYGLAEEVSGHSSWQTGEEYGGQHVTITAEFTSFKSHKDCIVFRSRVFLQNSRYSENALIKEAMATHSSDKMAAGLKDAGYATSSSYVESLKSIMTTYNLYRFDGMTVEQFESMTANGDAIVQAAYSQLGVPYVWGGSTPGVGLDCSGLTQYCYAQAGISIPHYTEDQKSALTTVLLSEAQPGDILYKYGHVAIYIGGDQYIHEPQTGDVCKVSSGINYFTCALRANR